MARGEGTIHKTQISLESQKRQLDLRYEAETEKHAQGSGGGPAESLHVLAKAPSRTPATPRASAPAPARPATPTPLEGRLPPLRLRSPS